MKKFFLFFLSIISFAGCYAYQSKYCKCFDETKEERTVAQKKTPEKRLIKGKVLNIAPLDLLSWWRFDIMAKYIYARHRYLGVKSCWATELYAEHLRVWGNFHEYTGTKNSFQDYVDAFHIILDSIKTEGFRAEITKVPVDCHGYPCEGAHRIASCLLYGKSVVCEVLHQKLACYASANYFKNYTRHVADGLQEKYLDAMALQYCGLKKNTSVIIVFPGCNVDLRNIKETIRACGDIVYDKAISLNDIGAKNISTFLSRPIDVFAKFFPKGSGDIRAFVVESKTPAFNKLYKILAMPGVYVAKNHKETLKLSQLFFVKNSIAFVNNQSFKKDNQLDHIMNNFVKWLNEKGYESEMICICGETASAIHNNKSFDRIDFIAHDLPRTTSLFQNGYIEYADNKYQDDTLRDDLIFNPERHFYYKGIKVSCI